MKRPTETTLVNACLDYLTALRIFAWRANVSGIRRRDARTGREFWAPAKKRGVSDVLAVLPGGRLLACECKMPGEGPTPDQRLFLDDVQRAGGLAIIVRSVDELAAALRAEGFGVVAAPATGTVAGLLSRALGARGK